MPTRTYLKPWVFGLAAGVLFVLGEVFLGIYPPSAYTFCLSCHTRDLVSTLANAAFGLRLPAALIARRVIILTSPGVLLGAWLAARRSAEHRVLRSDRPLRHFLLGAAVMIVGLAIFGCPTRLVLRAGYGEWYGLVAVIGMVAGIGGGTLLMRLRTRLRV